MKLILSTFVTWKSLILSFMILSSIKKLASLLTKNQIVKVSGLLVLLLIGMLFEIIGIGILLPTLEIISDPTVFYSNKYLLVFKRRKIIYQ